MRQLFILAAFLFVVAGCKSKKTYFEIKGKILHAKGTKLSLKQLSIGVQNPVMLDTSSIAKDGSFDLKTFMPYGQDLYVLSIDNGPDVYLINDEASITLNLDIDHYKEYTVEGSPASKQLHSFLDAYTPKYKTLVAEVSTYDSIQKSEASDDDVLVHLKAKDAALKATNDILTKSIQESSSPALRSYLLAKSFSTLDKASISKWIGVSKEQFKGYAPIDFLEKIIKQQLKTEPTPYALLNKQAPQFTSDDMYGKPFDLDSTRGKYVLLNFWASWNTQSRDENPNLGKAYHLYKDRNLMFLGVSLDSTQHACKNAVDDDNLYWRNICDTKEWKSPIVNKYKVTTLPFNVLLDTTGKIIAANLKGRDLTMKLNEVLPR